MSKWVCNITWNDAPHLTEDEKTALIASYSPHERDARSKGIPQLGAGAIYPIVEDEVVCQPFTIPDKWVRAYGMDVGWKKTAAIFGAYNEKEDVWYLYSEYYKGYAEPSVHANGIAARGHWMPGVVDCHSDRHSEAGGLALLTMYEKLGLNISKAENGPGTLEPGLLDVYQRLSSGRLKVFTNCLNWLAEFRVYRRDNNGRIVKQNDHLMDATRYLITSGGQVAECPPVDELETTIVRRQDQGRSGVCGY